MFKLIARAFVALLAAVTANLAFAYQIGHVTFIDNASGQILVDNQLVAVEGDTGHAGLRLGDEVALVVADDLLIAILEPITTGAISRSESLAVESLGPVVKGLVTFADAASGVLVLDNSVVLGLDGQTLASLRLGQLAQTRYSTIAGRRVAGAITILE